MRSLMAYHGTPASSLPLITTSCLDLTSLCSVRKLFIVKASLRSAVVGLKFIEKYCPGANFGWKKSTLA